MGKTKIYGVKLSPPVRACLLTATAIGLDYELVEVDILKNEQLSKEYLEKNPQHTIPTLEDDGKFIWDSHAIIAYLVGKYAKDDSLYPKDLYQRAIIDQRLHFDSGILFPKLRAGVCAIALKGETSKVPENIIQGLKEGWDFLEKFLEKNSYVAGDHLTLADLSLISTVSTVINFVPVCKDKHPKLLARIKKMETLPYYAEANDFGSQILIGMVKQKMEELKAKGIN